MRNRSFGERHLQRIWSVVGAVSVRTKVLGIVLGTVVLLGTFVTLQVRQSLADILDKELETQAQAIAAHVVAGASNLIETSNSDSLNVLVRETQTHYSDPRHNTRVAYLFITTPGGDVLAGTFAGSVPPDLVTANRLLRGQETSLAWHAAGEGRVLDIAEAFELPNGGAGVVRIGLSDQEIRTAVSRVTRQLVIMIAIMSLAGIAAAVFLTWLITSPIRNLVHAAQAVAAGDLTQRVKPWANDEIGRLAIAFNAMTEALSQAAREQAERADLRAQFVNRVIEAQEDERQRIARELHDSTGQALTSLLVGLRALEQTDPEHVRQQTDDLRQIVSHTLEEVHTLAWQLRPSALDDWGLPAALERYVADFRQRYGLPVDLTIHGLEGSRLSPEVETSIYRIVQEALTNVARHAQASQVSVLVEHHDSRTRAIVEDNGVGLDPSLAAKGSRKHLGLYGIRERAELLGGTLRIESVSQSGTSVFVEIPDQAPSPSAEMNQDTAHHAPG